MKKLLTVSFLGLMGLLGANTASAQLHNMGLQMDMVWPKGGGYTKDFSSLYGGLFYEYRFQGLDEDVNEAIDHFGVEFGVNYTEFIFKNTAWNLTQYATNNSSIPSNGYAAFFGTNSPYAKLSNKGVNLYVAPKYYITLYPDLVEMYLMGKVGYQYLNTSGSLSGNNANVSWNAVGGSNSKLFVGASLGVEVKLGTVFVGTNFGFDNNSVTKIMRNEVYKQSGITSPVEIKPFANMDKIWGNLVLEFKVKALLNGKN